MNQSNEKVIKNASWIILCRIMQSLCAFLIGAFTARYLGPSYYGLISYAASVVAFFLPLMRLGLTNTLVQEFIMQPEKEGKILGTSLGLTMVSSIVCIIGISAFSIAANPTDNKTIIVCILYSLTLFFHACEMIQYWFQAKLQSKYPSVAALVAYILVAIYKIYILIAGKNVYWFSVTHVLETMIIAGILFVVYIKSGGQKLEFSWSLGKEMLSRSKYYISAAMTVVVFQQTDRVMLRWLTDETETGVYSAALTCAGITGFVFLAIIDSARPSILESKKKCEKDYKNRMVLLYSIVTVLALAQSIGMTVFAKLIVWIIFGEAFLPAAAVLQISVWYITFSYYGNVRNIWILAEGKHKYLWKINLLGALTNVCLNLILIPHFGGKGAAIASLVSQFLVNVALCFFFKPIRPCGRFICDAFKLSSVKKLIMWFASQIDKKQKKG